MFSIFTTGTCNKNSHFLDYFLNLVFPPRQIVADKSTINHIYWPTFSMGVVVGVMFYAFILQRPSHNQLARETEVAEHDRSQS